MESANHIITTLQTLITCLSANVILLWHFILLSVHVLGVASWKWWSTAKTCRRGRLYISYILCMCRLL